MKIIFSGMILVFILFSCENSNSTNTLNVYSSISISSSSALLESSEALNISKSSVVDTVFKSNYVSSTIQNTLFSPDNQNTSSSVSKQQSSSYLTTSNLSQLIVEVSSSSHLNKVVSSSSDLTFNGDSLFKDIRDNQWYKMTKIGKQIWMAENLNYQNGHGINCYNNIDSCGKFGMLYDYESFTTFDTTNSNPSGIQSMCPVGWHMPSDAEWEQLVEYIAADQGIATKEDDDWKQINQFLVDPKSWRSFYSFTNPYNFSALLNEGKGYGMGSDVGNASHWWTITKAGNDNNYCRGISTTAQKFIRFTCSPNAKSVRCINDQPSIDNFSSSSLLSLGESSVHISSSFSLSSSI